MLTLEREEEEPTQLNPWDKVIHLDDDERGRTVAVE
jgi:hypothetical protein